MKWILLICCITSLAFAHVQQATIHDNDAQNIEQQLLEEGYATDDFEILILRMDGCTDVCILWQNYAYADASEMHRHTVNAVAEGLEGFNWNLNNLNIGYDDLTTSISVRDILEYSDLSEEGSTEELMAFLSEHTALFAYDE